MSKQRNINNLDIFQRCKTKETLLLHIIVQPKFQLYTISSTRLHLNGQKWGYKTKSLTDLASAGFVSY